MNLESISSENLNKDLAYLLGVYLTDGSISSSKDKWSEYYNFSLKAIDIEFVERTLNSFKKINNKCKANVYIQNPRTRYWEDGRVSKTQIQYCMNVGFKDYKDFFIEQTGNKHHIPSIIWDAPLQIKKVFIAGIMDGDGWISKTKREKNNRYQYRIGVGGVEEGWILEFKEFLQKMKIKTLKTDRNFREPKNKIMTSFGIKVESFIENGLFFTIKRKQIKLKEYIKRRSETKRCTS